MAENTAIQWTDNTLNFWWGCQKVSQGCSNCYAESFSKRVGRDIWGPPAATQRWRTKGTWNDVLKWQRQAAKTGQRKKVFTMSMGDFFEDHPQVNSWRLEALDILEACDMLDFQLLTKRPENILKMVPGDWRKEWPEHVWIGTSVENQAVANERIPHLINIPAMVKFLSMEPLLETVDILCLDKFDWVIVGGESGHHSREMPMSAVRSIIEDCQEFDVALFIKQMGEVQVRKMGLADKKGGDWDEWPDHLKIRQFPKGVNSG